METVKHVLTYPIAGVPAWYIVLFSFVFPLVNELIQRWKSVRAQSLLQAIGNVLSSPPLDKVPLVAQLLLIFTVFRTKTPPSLDGAEVVARRDGGAK